jgi:hypothetical protein
VCQPEHSGTLGGRLGRLAAPSPATLGGRLGRLAAPSPATLGGRAVADTWPVGASASAEKRPATAALSAIQPAVVAHAHVAHAGATLAGSRAPTQARGGQACLESGRSSSGDAPACGGSGTGAGAGGVIGAEGEAAAAVSSAAPASSRNVSAELETPAAVVAPCFWPTSPVGSSRS